MIEGIHLTPTENKLMRVLIDGEPHSIDELIGVLDDSRVYERTALRQCLSELRVKLRPRSEDIIAQSFGTYIRYRYIRLITKSPAYSPGK